MTKFKVLITGSLYSGAIEKFGSHPTFELAYLPDCSRETLLQEVKNAHVLVSRSETDVDKQVIDAAKDLKVIGRAAVGVGNIDLQEATDRGILVINCPGKNTNSAAELTMALMLSMMRKLPQAHSHVKAGGWDRHRFTGKELRGKRLGIVGLGNVGHRVARFAEAFDMEVYSYDPYIASDAFQKYRVRSIKNLEEMASMVDVLSVHVPLNRETKGMISEAVLEAMPKGSYIVNAARGGIIDEELLLKYLNSEHLAGVAIDTFEQEPRPREDLVSHPAVWCSPHIGASTHEAQRAIGMTIYEQVVRAMEGGVVDYPVNLPQVGVIDDPVLKAYAVLAEKLGAFVGQIIDFNPDVVELQYRGDIAELDHALIRMGWMKGYAGQVIDGYVSFVNVESHFEKMAIRIEEREDPQFQSYKSALKVVIRSGSGEQLTIGGIVFEGNHARVSLINDYYFEMDASGEILVIENHDRPGVIGDIGQFLGAHGINVDKFELSRNRQGGMAMSLISLDQGLDSAQVKAMRQIANIVSVRSVSL